MDRVQEDYTHWYSVLTRIATELEELLRDHLQGTPHVDHVSARAKTPERFAEKASKLNDDGSQKYEAPLEQIQDLIGARITVLYYSDVAKVTEVVRRYFPRIEEQEVVPDNNWKFGYFGKHFVLALPMDTVPDDIERDNVPRMFELQIKTVFQHAWSEASHDLGYKATSLLSNDQERRFAFTAAQAWGADLIFDELLRELILEG